MEVSHLPILVTPITAFFSPSERRDGFDTAPPELRFVCVVARGPLEVLGPRLALVLVWVFVEGDKLDGDDAGDEDDDTATGIPLTWLDSVVSVRLIDVVWVVCCDACVDRVDVGPSRRVFAVLVE